MNICFRILTYARPFKKRACYYTMATVVSVVFEIVGCTLLIPLLQVLFNQATVDHLPMAQSFSKWSIGHFTQLFDLLFIKVILSYGKLGALCCLSCLLVIAIFLRGLFRYIADMMMANICLHITCNLRLSLFKKILALPLHVFTDRKKGDLMARMVTDIQEVKHAVADSLRIFFKEPIRLIGYTLVLFYISPKLSFFILFCLPTVVYIMFTIIKQLCKWADQTQQLLGNFTHFIEEVLSSMYIIKIFGYQRCAVDRLKKENKIYAYTNYSLFQKEFIIAPASELFVVIIIAITLIYGGHLILSNDSTLTASTFITYICISLQKLVPIRMISRYMGHVQQGLAAARRIFQLLDEQSEQTRTATKLVYSKFQEAIVLKNISFAYSGQQPCLSHVDLTIYKGETVAILGPSGAGKSTLLSLLSGLYRPNRGEVTIDDLPIEQMSNDSLQNLMGVVTQEPILWHDTIFNNIICNRSGFTQEEVIQAAKIASAHCFIMNLPQGYDTIIGTRGDKLSGGQKQCICLARALLGDPPILILDEATSALDSISEREIQLKLQSLVKQKTSIIIAHRLSTIYHVDRIVVLEQGKIIEQGSHLTLLKQEGMYKKLFMLQQN